MFKSVSWQEFFFAVSIVLGLYYFGLLLILLFRYGKRRRENDLHEDPASDTSNVMGKLRGETPRKNERSLGTEEVIVDPGNRTELDEDAALLIGPVSDLLNEITMLTRVIKANNLGKEQSHGAFKRLLAGYPQVAGSKYHAMVSACICESFSDDPSTQVSLAEVATWWVKTNG